MFVVFYAIVNEGENGTEVQSPFLGGVTQTLENAERLAYSIVNDKSMPGTVIPKVLGPFYYNDFKKRYDFAVKHFIEMAKDINDYEMTQKRMRTKK